MSERASLTQALAHHATSTVTSLPKHESSHSGSSVGKHEPRDHVGAGTSFVSRLGVAGSIDHRPPTSLHVQPPISSPDSLIHPDVCKPARGYSILYQAVSQIEETATDRDRDGIELSDHLPRDAAQVLADAVHEVRPHAPSLPRRAV